MVLYTCASCILGWASLPHLAEHLLAQRSLNLQVTRALSPIAAFYCAACALAAWALLPPAACLAFSFGGVCMAGLLICDIRTRVLPTELVAFFLVFAVAFRLTVDSLPELLEISVYACAIAGFCVLVNCVYRWAGKGEALGMGDIRCIVPLVIFSGAEGALCGMLACALVMGVIACAQVLLRRAVLSEHVPMAPGLAAWLLVGMLMPVMM